MTPLLSVVIPTLGQSPHLRGLLERLQRQTTTFSFHVLVVANVPSQALRKLVNSMGDRRSRFQKQFEYLETGRLGVNLARNKGLERAQGSIVLFLDDDTILESDSFLSEHVERHQAYPEAAAVGGPYHLAAQHSFWDEVYHQIANEWLLQHSIRQGRTTQLLGGNLSLKKEILEKHGWKFDEPIAFGGAESGLCSRLTQAGYDLVFEPALSVGHAPDMTRLSFCRKAFLQGAGAHWRSVNISPPSVRYVNEMKPTKNAQRLYAMCFDYGWWLSPYTRGRSASFNLPRFFLFLLRRVHLWSQLRGLHRDIYTMLRAAWINRDLAVPAAQTSGLKTKP